MAIHFKMLVFAAFESRQLTLNDGLKSFRKLPRIRERKMTVQGNGVETRDNLTREATARGFMKSE